MSVWKWVAAIWHDWIERSMWAKQVKDVPDHQLRATVFQNPAKQRWVKRVLWRREKLWGQPISLASIVISIVALIVSIAK